MDYVEKQFRGRPFRVCPESSAVVDDEEPILPCLGELGPGDLFVDVGAGHGTFALRALALGASVRAFEPHPPTRELLSRNVSLTLGVAPRADVVVHREALFDGGPLPEVLLREVLLREVFGRHYPTDEEIPVRTLDSCGFERVRMVKLDVEGAELGVLLGGTETIRRDMPVLLIEDHAGVNPDPACLVSRYAEGIDSSRRIRELLGDWGYGVEVRPWGCGRRYLVARAR